MEKKGLISVMSKVAKKKKDFINRQILLSIFRKCTQSTDMIHT